MGEIIARPLRQLGEYDLPIYDEKIAQSIEERMAPGPYLSASQRLGIYNQQFWFRMFVILQSDYPSLLRLFGYEEFNRFIVEPYILKYFPNHWSLSSLGRKLPQWIAEEYGDEDKWLVQQLATIDALYERLPLVRPSPKLEDINGPIYLQPFVAIVDLEGDLLKFREELLREEPNYWQERDFPKIDGGGSFVLAGKQGEIEYEKISPAQALLLRAFEKGATLEEACHLLQGTMIEEAERNIGDWFRKWGERGWFTGKI